MINKVRVLSVQHYPTFGGPHNEILMLEPHLKLAGVQTIVAMTDQAGNAAARLDGHVELRLIPLRRTRWTWSPWLHLKFAMGFLQDIAALRMLIREYNIDIVKVHGTHNPQGAIAARLEAIPIVWVISSTRLPAALRRVGMIYARRLADIVLSTGEAVARAHPGAEALGERLHVYFPPVDPSAFAPGVVDRGAARVEFGFASEDLVVGTVGNLNPQKGHEYLIRAAAAARDQGTSVKAILVGASYDTHREYERGLRRLSTELGFLTGRDIVFAGPRDDVRPALAAMDIFVLSSVPASEGAPTAIQEAMMMGLPVVATDVGAVAEVVEDGVTGYVVPPLDAGAIAEATVRLLRDPALRERMGRAGRERAVERFSVERCAEVHVQAYHHALRRRGTLLTHLQMKG